MEDLLKKIFEKYFRFRIKKDWKGRLDEYTFTEEEQKEIGETLHTSVVDSIECLLSKIKDELDDLYEIINGVIDDSVFNIEVAREEAEAKAKEVETEDDFFTSEDEEKMVLCSYKNLEECGTCDHSTPHEHDVSSCDNDCAYISSDQEYARCKEIEIIKEDETEKEGEKEE